MLNNTEMNDDVIILPCAQRGQMEVEDEPPLSLIYDKCFASLMRVARTAWKPLLWDAALALTSSTSARYFLNKPKNEGDITAETLQGGLVFLWKNSCQRHKVKNQHVLAALKRKAPPLEEALETLKSFLTIRKYPLDHCGEWFFPKIDERWELFQVKGKNLQQPYRHHGSWPYAIDSIIKYGLTASQHMELGHSLHAKAPGVYTSRSLKISAGYARPTNLFGDGALYQFLFLVNAYGKPKKTYEKEGFQEVWETNQVEIAALLVKINDFALEYGTEYIANFCSYFESHPNRLPEIVFSDPRSFTIRHVRPMDENEQEDFREMVEIIQTGVEKVQSLALAVPITSAFCEAYIDMKQSLYRQEDTWNSNFIQLLNVPHVLEPELTAINLNSASMNWRHIAHIMAEAETDSTWVDDVEEKTLNELGGVLQGLLAKALNEKYKGKYLRDCLDFCFFAKVLNFFATKRDNPLRCVACFVDDKVAYDELLIKKIEVRTHFGDPTQKWTKSRRRTWTNPRTGEQITYNQSSTTRRQRTTLTSRAAEQRASNFASASTELYRHAAEMENDTIYV